MNPNIETIINRFLLLPVWLLTLAIRPFLPKTHPWKKEKCSLAWWEKGATVNALIFGTIFWMQGITIYTVIWLWLR